MGGAAVTLPKRPFPTWPLAFYGPLGGPPATQILYNFVIPFPSSHLVRSPSLVRRGPEFDVGTLGSPLSSNILTKAFTLPESQFIHL